MALKNVFKRPTPTPTPAHEVGSEELREFRAAIPGHTDIAAALPRQEVTVVGEVKYVRVVPRPNGSPSLEATVEDGTGSLTVLWTGRKNIAGIQPGSRVVITGRGAPNGPGGRLLIYNPRYELR